MDCHVYLFSLICILKMFQQLECAPTTLNIPELNASSTKSDDTFKNGINSTIVNSSTSSGKKNEVSTTESSDEGLERIVNTKNGEDENQERSLVQEKLSNNPMSWSRVKRDEEDDEEPPCSQDDSAIQTVDNSSEDETGEEEDSSSDTNEEPFGQSDSSDTEDREERSAFFEGAEDRSRSLSSWYGEPSFGRRYWSSNERRRKFLTIPIFTGR